MNLNDLYDLPGMAVAGSINPDMAAGFHRRCVELQRQAFEQDCDQVVVTMSTTGGWNVYARAFHEELRLLNKIVRVNLVVVGSCLSGGVTVLMAVPMDQRFATRNSMFMVHQSQNDEAGIPDLPLPARQLIERERQAHRQGEQLEMDWVARQIATGCGIDLEEAVKLIDETSWLAANRALYIGLIGGIVRETYSKRRGRKAMIARSN